MTNSKILLKELVNQVNASYDRSEAEAIIYRLLENKVGLCRKDILSEANTTVTLEQFNESIERINKHEPIQYILNEEEFFGRKFYVDTSVLIPRPETEELVRQGIDLLPKQNGLRILDIGTGSGCIPITLALEIPIAQVFATDISESALNVARRNATSLNAKVEFLKHNILLDKLPYLDIDLIISNPPYISQREKESMSKNVLAYEPHSALFTGSEDVLIFYKAIAKQAVTKLKAGGYVAMEINERSGTETAAIFMNEWFSDVRIVKDINQKDRFVIARKN